MSAPAAAAGHRSARSALLPAIAVLATALLASCASPGTGAAPATAQTSGSAMSHAASSAASSATGHSAAPSGAGVASPGTGVARPKLPPAHGGFDYQLGGAYPPPPGVQIVSRDHTDNPAPGLYNICYVNAFQAQPDARGQWPADLLLTDANGHAVIDQDWNEALLDISTAAKRQRVAAKVGQWIDECARKGFNAVEPDNYDSYTRSGNLLTAADAQAFIILLAARAHARGLAIAQKNAAELAAHRTQNGLDFAIAEECADYGECGTYATAFNDHVIVIEYTDQGLRKACSAYASRLSIVRRDRNLTTPGSPDYVRQTC